MASSISVGNFGAGHVLNSPDGRYELIQQSNGNLVEIDQTNLFSKYLFETKTAGNSGAYTTVQTDGNLVVYSKDHHPLWASNTHDSNTNHVPTLTVQNDGNVVLYDVGGSARWSSITGPLTFGPLHNPIVYTIDDFGTNTYSMNVGHGELVSKLIETGSGVKPIALNLTLTNDPDGSHDGLKLDEQSHQVETILHSTKSPLDNVYVNMSIADAAFEQQKFPLQWLRLSLDISLAVERGVKFFVSSGNTYPNYISSIKGVITVGSTTLKASDGTAYVKNKEIDVRENPLVVFFHVPGGLDITGDQIPEFPEPIGTSYYLTQEGTSFSTPRALADAIATRHVPQDIIKASSTDFS